MKVFKPIVVALSMLLSLSACAGGGGKQTTTKQRKETKMGVIHLTKDEFLKKVCNYEANPNAWKYEGDKPCIVDFFATWCGPCKMLSPIMDSLAEEYEGKIVIYKVDVDQEEDLAGAFGVNSIPTLLWVPMKGDPIVTRGAMMKSDLKKMIDEKLMQSK